MRDILLRSNVGAAAVAVLLLWSLISAADAVGQPVYIAVTFVVNLIGTLDFSYAFSFSSDERFMILLAALSIATAIVYFVAAWLLSRWICGESPLRYLARYHATLSRGRRA
ncbi:MAG TPA: hypothetical protein VIY69_16340 [Candidatus Acidoferrales bacterium]